MRNRLTNKRIVITSILKVVKVNCLSIQMQVLKIYLLVRLEILVNNQVLEKIQMKKKCQTGMDTLKYCLKI